MAVSATMQSIIVNPISSFSNRAGSNFVLVPSVVRVQRNLNMKVKCMAGQKDEPTPTKTPSPISTTTPPSPSKKLSTRFFNIFAFSGPAPERINGRLAMIGFVAALTAELYTGQDVLAQIANGGVPWFLGTSVVLTIASAIPLFKGVSVQSKSDGIMTSDAEMWNGRFAMLGFVALAFTEYVKGSALV